MSWTIFLDKRRFFVYRFIAMYLSISFWAPTTGFCAEQKVNRLPWTKVDKSELWSGRERMPWTQQLRTCLRFWRLCWCFTVVSLWFNGRGDWDKQNQDMRCKMQDARCVVSKQAKNKRLFTRLYCRFLCLRFGGFGTFTACFNLCLIPIETSFTWSEK